MTIVTEMPVLDFKNQKESFAREGMIIECPLNGQYQDRRDVILIS